MHTIEVQTYIYFVKIGKIRLFFITFIKNALYVTFLPMRMKFTDRKSQTGMWYLCFFFTVPT